MPGVERDQGHATRRDGEPLLLLGREGGVRVGDLAVRVAARLQRRWAHIRRHQLRIWA